MVVAERIKQARTEHLGLTQRELGDALGIDQVNVSRWERGIAEPRIKHLRELAVLAELPLSWFFEEVAA